MTPLKKARLCMQFSQAEVAGMLGVNQSTYQRWESSTSKIPEGKLGKLAESLDTTKAALLGAQQEDFYFLKSDDGELTPNYFGEIAIHFKSGTSLMFAISTHQRNCFAENYFDGNPFIPMIGMNNRSYLISRESILDVYLSDDSAGEYGPEEKYDEDGVKHVDEEEWGLVEAVADGLEFFEPEGVDTQKLAHILMILGKNPDDFRNFFPADFDFSQINRVEALNELLIKKIYHCATAIEWQLSNGRSRAEDLTDDALLKGFSEHLRMGGECEESSIYLDFEDRDFSVLTNSRSVNYLSCPTHAYERALLRELEQEIDG